MIRPASVSSRKCWVDGEPSRQRLPRRRLGFGKEDPFKIGDFVQVFARNELAYRRREAYPNF